MIGVYKCEPNGVFIRHLSLTPPSLNLSNFHGLCFDGSGHIIATNGDNDVYTCLEPMENALDMWRVYISDFLISSTKMWILLFAVFIERTSPTYLHVSAKPDWNVRATN